MKLTREGAARLGRYESRGFPVGDFDFQPDDFDGCFQNGKGHVTLTVEEAKALLRRIPEFKENDDWQLPIERLKERIAKAEGKE